MPKNKKCRFETELPRRRHVCPQRALEGSDYCIFHKRDKTEQEAQLFKQKITNKLQNQDYDFEGYCFPTDATFENQVFSEEADFAGTTFEGETHFEGSTFENGADFEGSTFKESAYFRKITFEKQVNFGSSIFKRKAHFEKSTCKRGTTFQGATFEGDANFRESILKGSPGFFQNSTFKGHTSFRGSTFKAEMLPWDVCFEEATFERDADFEASTFEEDANFRESTFKAGAYFKGATFKRDAGFTRSTFRDFATFKGAIFEGDAYFENTVFRNIWAAEGVFRILKSHYQRQGRYTLAGEYYYKERIAIRKQLPLYHPKRWFEYILLDGICGYGERPLRAIRTGLGVLFGLAFLYWRVGHIYPSPELFNEPHTLTFLDALYFSVVTFTTLGFGDWRPDPSHWIRYIVMSEAFIGAFLMALFIVTFARRMMR